MSIESIKGLLEGFDPSKLLPQISTVVGRVELITRLCVMAGPVLLTVLGLIYLFVPPKEANHRLGYRCYFGMGSLEAWRFTQRIAGMAFGGLGLILTVAMLIVCAGFRGKPIVDMVTTALTCMFWEAIPVALACLGVNVTAAIFFDEKGNPRKQ